MELLERFPQLVWILVGVLAAGVPPARDRSDPSDRRSALTPVCTEPISSRPPGKEDCECYGFLEDSKWQF